MPGLSSDPEKRKRQLANLNPAKPGESRNPSGRPKDILTQTLRRLVDGKEAEALVRALLSEGRGGNIKALALAYERLEGKVAQPVDVKADVTVQRITELEVGVPAEPSS